MAMLFRHKPLAAKTKNETARETHVEKLRKDSALMASYSSVEEIDLAMARNIATEENLLRSLKKRSKSIQQTLNESLALAEAKRSRNMEPSKYLVEKISIASKKLEFAKTRITETQNNINLIKQRFASYKSRYAELSPRNSSLSAIKYNTRNLEELERWKHKANENLSFYLKESIKYKRTGRPIPQDIVVNIQAANREIAKADQAIANIRAIQKKPLPVSKA